MAVEDLRAELIARSADYARAEEWSRSDASSSYPPRYVKDELAMHLEALGLAAVRYTRALAAPAPAVAEGVAPDAAAAPSSRGAFH